MAGNIYYNEGDGNLFMYLCPWCKEPLALCTADPTGIQLHHQSTPCQEARDWARAGGRLEEHLPSYLVEEVYLLPEEIALAWAEQALPHWSPLWQE